MSGRSAWSNSATRSSRRSSLGDGHRRQATTGVTGLAASTPAAPPRRRTAGRRPVRAHRADPTAPVGRAAMPRRARSTTPTSWSGVVDLGARHRRHLDPVGGEPQHGGHVVARATVAGAGIGSGCPHAADGPTAQRSGGVEHRGRLDRGGAERGSRCRPRPDPWRRRPDRRRSTVAAMASAEGIETASRSPPKAWPAVTVAVDQAGPSHGDHQIGQGEGQRGAVGHHVDDAAVGPVVEEGGGDDRHLAVQRARHDRDATEVAPRSRCPPPLAPVSVCSAGVPDLHDVARARRRPARRATGSSGRRASRRCPGRARPRWCCTTTSSPTATGPDLGGEHVGPLAVAPAPAASRPRSSRISVTTP